MCNDITASNYDAVGVYLGNTGFVDDHAAKTVVDDMTGNVLEQLQEKRRLVS